MATFVAKSIDVGAGCAAKYAQQPKPDRRCRVRRRDDGGPRQDHQIAFDVPAGAGTLVYTAPGAPAGWEWSYGK